MVGIDVRSALSMSAFVNQPALPVRIDYQLGESELMKDWDHLLQPFDERTLMLVRSAYQRAWPQLSRGQGDPSLVRNRLVGTLATLASGGIVDQAHLEREALRRLSA